MILPSEHLVVLWKALLATYISADDLEIVVFQASGGLGMEDLSNNTTRPKKYLDVVRRANASWIPRLVAALVEDQHENPEFLEQIAPMRRLLDPEPGFDVHQHLITDGSAFANHIPQRNKINEMAEGQEQPRIMIIRGDPLAGASHFWRFINHVGRLKAGAERFRHDFGRPGDHSPVGVMTQLGLNTSLGTPPSRRDLPSEEHLAAYMANWLVGKLRNSNSSWWLTFDNANRSSIPEPTKEMIIELIIKIADSTLHNTRLFILGFDLDVTGLPENVANDTKIFRIDRQAVEDYLQQVEQRFGGIPEYQSVQAAVTDVVDGVDFANPTRDMLENLTAQLSEITLRAREQP